MKSFAVALLCLAAACTDDPVSPAPPTAHRTPPSLTLIQDDEMPAGDLLSEVEVDLPAGQVDSTVDLVPPGVLPTDGAIVEISGTVRLGNGTLVPITDVISNGVTIWYRSGGNMMYRAMGVNFFDLSGNGQRYEFPQTTQPRDSLVRMWFTPSAGGGLRMNWFASEAQVGGAADTSPGACGMMISFVCIVAPPPTPAWTSDGVPTGHLRVRVYRTDSDAPPRLLLRCDPASQTRGATITCTARLNNRGKFLVVTADAYPAITGVGRSGLPFKLPIQFDSFDGDTRWVSEGPAVAATQLQVSVLTQPADPLKITGLSASTSFGVEPRSVAEFGEMAPTGPVDVQTTLLPRLPNGTLFFGLAHPPALDDATPPIERVDWGPNAGLVYLSAAPQVRPLRVWLNAGLNGEGWGAEQVGNYNGATISPTGYPYCDQTYLTRLRAFARRHEGATDERPSHVGFWLDMLRGPAPAELETFVAPAGLNDAELRRRIDAALDAPIARTTLNVQLPFDSAEYGDGTRATEKAVGCTLVPAP